MSCITIAVRIVSLSHVSISTSQLLCNWYAILAPPIYVPNHTRNSTMYHLSQQGIRCMESYEAQHGYFRNWHTGPICPNMYRIRQISIQCLNLLFLISDTRGYVGIWWVGINYSHELSNNFKGQTVNSIIHKALVDR